MASSSFLIIAVIQHNDLAAFVVIDNICSGFIVAAAGFLVLCTLLGSPGSRLQFEQAGVRPLVSRGSASVFAPCGHLGECSSTFRLHWTLDEGMQSRSLATDCMRHAAGGKTGNLTQESMVQA